MIKGRSNNVVIIGLSRMNTERLMQDMPIRFDGAEVGLPGLVFVLFGGETEPAMVAQLREMGVLGPDTKIDDRYTGKGNQ